MTYQEIKERIKSIQEIAEKNGDNEVAHSEEDELYQDFIEYVAQRKDALGRKASLVLSTREIDFYRWYA
jgi:uncharacterized protein YgfB (UPF0149 family)